MGLFDKLKNALFEVEYVEVDEPPKKEKKVQEGNEDKPIAKKVILPGKREDRIEELEEEELKDQDFEIRPKEETMKVRTREEFKVMNDNDFKMDEDVIDIEEPQIIQVLDINNNPVHEERKEEGISEPIVEEQEVSVRQDMYVDKVDNTSSRYEGKLYGVDHSYDIPVYQYGTYEKKEEKTYFRPSPIISPIYGILDKNYKKEDVKEKKEIHLTSYSRSNATVDDVRNKAYGSHVASSGVESLDDEVADNTTKFDVEEEDNVLVDLSDRAKPEVKEITMGDAVEYFQDLGLEYNVDYMDVSKEKQVPKKEREKEVEGSSNKEKEIALTKDLEDTMELGATKKKKESEEKKVDSVGDDTNDNLFDLIDSMYQEND